jgi:hypothetical protein
LEALKDRLAAQVADRRKPILHQLLLALQIGRIACELVAFSF